MTTPRRARLARALGLALVVALLSIAGPALTSPSTAAPGCTTEETPEPTFPPTVPPDYGCDDTTPPDTTITEMTPTPNSADLTRTRKVTFTFAQTVSDGDSGPWTFMCKLEGPSKAHGYEVCTSPREYTDLEDTRGKDGVHAPYTFSVYAVDSADSAILYTGDPLTAADDESPAAADDDSATPATRTWKQDATAPIAYIFPAESGTPYDAEGTGWPIAKRPSVSYLLEASENDVDYRCQLDGANVACSEGENTFTGINGGEHVLNVSVKDKAGNEDNTPDTEKFVMPFNLGSARGWKKVDGAGFFSGDILQTKKYGATVKFSARNIEQFRLIAPAGPKLGKIQVRIGSFRWKTYDLSKGKATESRFIDLRGPNPPLFSGPIQIRCISRAKLVQVDAYVYPPS